LLICVQDCSIKISVHRFQHHPDFPAEALMANTTFRKLRAAIAPKLQQNPGRSLG